MTNATSTRFWAGAALLSAAVWLSGCGRSANAPEQQQEEQQTKQTASAAQPAPEPVQRTPARQQPTQPAPPPTAAPSEPHESTAAASDAAAAEAADVYSDPEKIVARYMQLLSEGKFEDVVPLLYINSDGYTAYIKSLDGMKQAREATGEEVYEQVRQYLAQSVQGVTWKVVRVSEDRAVVGYKGPRDDDPEKQFEVRLIKGRWLVVPPPEGMPMAR